MKFKYKLSAIIFILILLTSLVNYKLLSETVQALLTKRLETAEALLGKGMANNIYRLVIEERHEEITATIFKEKNLRETKLNYIVVKDRNKNIVAHTFLTALPKEIQELQDSFTEEENYRIDDLIEGNLGVYNIGIPIREGLIQVGTLHIGIDKQFIIDAGTPLKEASEKIFLIGLLIVLIGGALAYALSFAITQSISKITDLAQKISQGDYNTKIDIVSHDEIGYLANSLEIMRENIKAAQVELKRQNENLEEIVQERTQKLEHSNRELHLSHEELEAANEDLDEQRQNLKIVFSAMDYPLYVVNKDYTIEMMNDKAKELVLPDMPSPLTCYNLSHNSNIPCGTQESPCPLQEVFKEKKPIVIERSHIDENGEKVFIELRAYPIFDNDNNVVQMVEASIDITEKKKAADDKIWLERELSRAQKLESIGTLAAGVAHEINTPIQFVGDNTRFAKDSVNDMFNLIKDYQTLIEKLQVESKLDVSEELSGIEEDGDLEYLTDELPKSIQQTLEGVEHVTEIVKAMKEFSHIGASDDMQQEDINHAIETTLVISKNEWKYHADVVQELDPQLPTVPCFIGEIKQVLLNLIVNAAHTIADKKAIHKEKNEKGIITIKTSIDDDTLKVSVTDNGMGIPEEHRNQLFDHFYTTKEVSKGTGQGLSVAYQIITEKHGGEIWFETLVGEGTTFFFTLKTK